MTDIKDRELKLIADLLQKAFMSEGLTPFQISRAFNYVGERLTDEAREAEQAGEPDIIALPTEEEMQGFIDRVVEDVVAVTQPPVSTGPEQLFNHKWVSTCRCPACERRRSGMN